MEDSEVEFFNSEQQADYYCYYSRSRILLWKNELHFELVCLGVTVRHLDVLEPSNEEECSVCSRSLNGNCNYFARF